MGKRGPPKKPTKIKILEGNPGKKALPKNEPEPVSEGVSPPDWLDETGRAEWDRIAPELDRLGLLTVLDQSGLAAYCMAFAEFVKANKEIAKDGMMHKTPNGHLQPSPYIGIARGADERMRRYMREFGLTPAARVGLETDKQKPEDEFSAWQNSRKKG